MHNREYVVQYNVPRVNAQLPGKQNRITDQDLQITPGMDEPIVFSFGNQDGVPLMLQEMTIKFVVFNPNLLDHRTIGVAQSQILFAKILRIDDPYGGMATLLLDGDETLQIGARDVSILRWGLFAINAEDRVFPMQVSRTGGRYGTLRVDLASGIPPKEMILDA